MYQRCLALVAAGVPLRPGVRRLLAEARTLHDPFAAELRAIALTPDGRHGGAAGKLGSTYAVMTARSRVPEIRPRMLVS